MENILIAYNEDPAEELHSFFEDCADCAKQLCVCNGHDFDSVPGDQLTEQNVCLAMSTHTMCMIAAHGLPSGILNSANQDVISIRTTNYAFAGKVLYAVSCFCAQELLPQLKIIGLDTFVGYDESLLIIEGEPLFLESAMSGFKSLMEGDSNAVAKQKMLQCYTDSIDRTTTKDAKKLLLFDREHLCFE